MLRVLLFLGVSDHGIYTFHWDLSINEPLGHLGSGVLFYLWAFFSLFVRWCGPSILWNHRLALCDLFSSVASVE
ncbi:hypothetical protein PsAD2_03757 [Pseudovibrio axinellae]|uniref:Uncharacterized protein n=1 Tax=Pseudovibrio axinellae TaxID=989403 RepID=A0A165VMJ7_9HYPH|nr:hypothetical protein PsAD2_03757 [Pseudovibrio axinellae]